MMTVDPEDDPKIPLQYVAAYKDCNYLDLKKTASVLISMVTQCRGGIKFDIVEEYGEYIFTEKAKDADMLSLSYPTNDNMLRVNSHNDENNDVDTTDRKCSANDNANENNKSHVDSTENTQKTMQNAMQNMTAMGGMYEKVITKDTDITKPSVENTNDVMDPAKQELVNMEDTRYDIRKRIQPKRRRVQAPKQPPKRVQRRRVVRPKGINNSKEVTTTNISEQGVMMLAVNEQTVATQTDATTTTRTTIVQRRRRVGRPKRINNSEEATTTNIGEQGVMMLAGNEQAVATPTDATTRNVPKRVAPKRGGVASKKMNTVSDNNCISKYLMPVHNVQRVPLRKEVSLCKQERSEDQPKEVVLSCQTNEREQVEYVNDNVNDNINDNINDNEDNDNDEVDLSEPQQQIIYSWSRTMFLKRFWVSQKLREFEILMHFLYDTVKEGDMFVPARLTWLDHIKRDYNDPDTYAARILFILLCSKRVKDVNLSSLEEFVNSEEFSIDHVLQCGREDVKNRIRHLGLQNKNATDIMEIFHNIKLYQDKYKQFPRRLHILLQYKGIGRKIATLVLNFAYGQNEGISVDSHVLKCAIALRWVHPQCTTPESIRVSLQEWVSPCMWPHVNMVLASFGQLFSEAETTRHIIDIAMRDYAMFQQLRPLLLPLVRIYQPNMLF